MKANILLLSLAMLLLGRVKARTNHGNILFTTKNPRAWKKETSL